ncbi:MAG: discoidin domain-containing protein [Janthinobacterium lividum]
MKALLLPQISRLLTLLLFISNSLLAQNLALKKAAITSSTTQADRTASYAFDGEKNSRWESSYSDPQYLIVDLGSVQDVARVRLLWEGAYGKDFTLAISSVTTAPSDASWTNVVNGTWITVQNTQGNTSLLNDYTFRQRGRYVRLYGTARGTGYGYSLYEFEVYAYDPNPNLALGKLATGGSSDIQLAAKAVDGDGTTRWESAQNDLQTISIDLGSVQPIDAIRLTWEAALGKDFTLDVSDDGMNWQTVVPVTGNTSTSNEYTHLGASGRYVRMNGTKRGTPYSYSLYEFEVFATSNNLVNLANGQMGVASSTQGTLTENYAFDNDRLTRWSSTANLDNAFIYVDLQRTVAISRVYLVWEEAYGGDFTIDVSDDAATWTTVGTAVNNSFHFNEYRFPSPVAGRYVRMNGTKRGTTAASNGYSLYEFEVNAAPQPLPVTLSSFRAAAQGPGVRLNWATASEQHNAGFEVQRSADGADFTPLAFVKGAGTTPAAHAYQYLDAAPLRTTSYYRLQQLDTDGTFAYSPVVVMQALPTLVPLSFYPNPTADRATVAEEISLAGADRWYLTNSLGQVIHAEALSNDSTPGLSVDLQPYPAGSYVLTVEAGGQVVCRGRVQRIN